MAQKKNTKKSSWLVEIQSCAMSTEDGRAISICTAHRWNPGKPKGTFRNWLSLKMFWPFLHTFFLMRNPEFLRPRIQNFSISIKCLLYFRVICYPQITYALNNK